MHYKTIVKYVILRKTQVFQQPYPFIIKANLKNLGTVLFLRAQEIQKNFINFVF